MVYEFPNSIKSDFEGYSVLVDFHCKTRDLCMDEVVLDFQKTTWLDANLTAVLGAILSTVIESAPNDVKISGLGNTLENLLRRNHFLSHFGGYKVQDTKQTTIQYRKFKMVEEKLFKDYLDKELLNKQAIPAMSLALRKKINESIFEIFNNAMIHGKCQYITSCGQYYPTKKKLDFTIVDLGATIKANVNQYLGKNLTGKECISWAVEEGHTTKQGMIPGGLGLGIIRTFLEHNGGLLQIVSSDGYWEQRKGIIITKDMEYEFLGTIVNLEFNINDSSYYRLSSETDSKNIF